MQANARVLDVDANCAALDAAARAAAGEGAAVLVTPELFPVGYAPLRLRAELDPTGLPAIRETLAGIARRYGIGLVYSLPSVTERGSWHISSTLVDSAGVELLTYAKVHLFGDDERAAFSPAEAAPAVVDFNGFRTSMVICYDVEFPETVRAAALGRAELLLVPAALALGIDVVWLGVVMAINLQTAFISPPVGFSLFYLQSVVPEEVDTLDIHKGAIPFMVLQVVVLALVIIFPQTVTWAVEVLNPQ